MGSCAPVTTEGSSRRPKSRPSSTAWSSFSVSHVPLYVPPIQNVRWSLNPIAFCRLKSFAPPVTCLRHRLAPRWDRTHAHRGRCGKLPHEPFGSGPAPPPPFLAHPRLSTSRSLDPVSISFPSYDSNKTTPIETATTSKIPNVNSQSSSHPTDEQHWISSSFFEHTLCLEIISAILPQISICISHKLIILDM